MSLTRVKGSTFQSDENNLWANVRDFGAVADGSTDDAPAIQAAIDSLTNGGTVFLPKGTYALASGTGIAALQMRSGIHLRGGGIAATNLALANATDLHIVNIVNDNDWGVSEMTLDGNGANQTSSVNGIRIGTTARGFVRNVEIKKPRQHGIDLVTGTNTDLIFDCILMQEIGANGINVLNVNDNSVRNIINNVLIKSFGDVTSASAGLDIRGPWEISNVRVEGIDGNESGIRLRDGELGAPNGLGAHNTNLSNFSMIASTPGSCRGLNILARDCAISNGYIFGCQLGINVKDNRNRLVNIRLDSCDPLGIRVETTASPGGDLVDTLITNCVFDSNTAEGLEIRGDRTIVNSCDFINNTTRGIEVQAAASDSLIVNSNFFGNGVAVLDNGVNTHARNNNGWKTEAFIAGAALAWDSTGLKTQTIAHGLDVTPTIDQCRISKVKLSGNNDGAFDWTMVSAVDATNVTADSIVGTANSAGGAQFQHVVSINARP